MKVCKVVGMKKVLLKKNIIVLLTYWLTRRLMIRVGMRLLFALLLVFAGMGAWGQKKDKCKIKVINCVTQKPIRNIFYYLLKDNDKMITFGETNNSKINIDEIKDFDSNSTYQILIIKEEYFHLKQNIYPCHQKKNIICLLPDSNIIKKNPNLVYMHCPIVSFGNYEAKEALSYYDLPDSIRIKLKNHLISRLGREFYSKINFHKGQIVDLNRLYIVNENAKNYEWTPYSYYLCLSLQDVSKGIGLYIAKIVLDKFGNVIEEVEFPNIQKFPEKENIISLEQAKNIVKDNKFEYDLNDIELIYDKTIDSITWNFGKTDNKRDVVTYFRIDAHNGKVLEQYGSGFIR